MRWSVGARGIETAPSQSGSIEQGILDDMKDVLLALLGVATGVLLMAAPYYAQAALKAYAGYLFWGGLSLTVMFIVVVVAMARRGSALQNARSTVNSRDKLPTFEATRGSTIDATGATIPGDLPFQFGKADDHSVISMPGATVTRKDDGTLLVTSGNSPTQFPPPTGEFSPLSNDDLKLQSRLLRENLGDLQRRLSDGMEKLNASQNGRTTNADYKAFYDPHASEYRTEIAPRALSLASELLLRLGSVTPTTLSANNGATMILYKAFAGRTPASDAADFLEYLEQQLPPG